MRPILTGLIVLAISAGAAGCRGISSLRFAPGEDIKDAAAIVVADLHAQQGHVDEAGESLRREALAGAKAAQVYVGLPNTSPEPTAVENAAALARAEAEGARRPGAVDVAEAVLAETEFWYEQLSPWLLGLIPGIAGVGVALKRGRELIAARRTYENQRRAGEQIINQNQAVMDGPVGQIPVEVAGQQVTVADMMKLTYKGQDAATRQVVAAVKT